MSEAVIRSTPGSDRWAAITKHSAVHWHTEWNLNIEYEKDHFSSCRSVSICRKLASDRNEFVYSLLTMLMSLKVFHPSEADETVESLSNLPNRPKLRTFCLVWAAETTKEFWCRVFMVNAAVHIKAALFQLFVPPWNFNYSWTCLWVNFWVFVSSAVPWRIHSCTNSNWLFNCDKPGAHTVFDWVELSF